MVSTVAAVHVFRVRPTKPSQIVTNVSTSSTVPDDKAQLRRSERGFRGRASHHKSRNGCQQCKGVRKKCNEAQPQCQRCQNRQIKCQYEDALIGISRPSRLGRSHHIHSHRLPGLTCSILPIAATLINQGLESSSFVLQGQDLPSFTLGEAALQNLSFFQDSTCSTLGTPSIQVAYRAEILRLAVTRPYLLHAVIALTCAHHRHLTGVSRGISAAERNHISMALSAYNTRLSYTFSNEDADALLATSTLLNAFFFASTTSSDPLKSWPLVTSPTDLQWLTIQKGPELMMALTEDWEKESLFRSTFADFDISASDSSGDDVQLVSITFFRNLQHFCGLLPGSISSDNPYAHCLDLLGPMLATNAMTANMAQFLPFISSLRPPFIELLQAHDQRALLILAFWYALVSSLPQWWLATRARTECIAICVFLRQLPEQELQDLVEFVVERCYRGSEIEQEA